MNLKKGTLRAVVAVLWLLLWWVGYVFAVWPLFAPVLGRYLPSLTLLLLASVIFGCYPLPIVLIRWRGLVEPQEEFLDFDDLCTKVVALLSIIAGVVSMVIYAHLTYPARSFVSYRGFIITFVLGFVLIFGNYVLIRWIVEGVRQPGLKDCVG